MIFFSTSGRGMRVSSGCAGGVVAVVDNECTAGCFVAAVCVSDVSSVAPRTLLQVSRILLLYETLMLECYTCIAGGALVKRICKVFLRC